MPRLARRFTLSLRHLIRTLPPYPAQVLTPIRSSYIPVRALLTLLSVLSVCLYSHKQIKRRMTFRSFVPGLSITLHRSAQTLDASEAHTYAFSLECVCLVLSRFPSGESSTLTMVAHASSPLFVPHLAHCYVYLSWRSWVVFSPP